VWGKHPDEMLGEPYHEGMLWDMAALSIVEAEEREAGRI